MAVPFVGLTGGLGAGKSTALELLGELGVATLSTDAVVHELYGDAELREALVGRWGPEVVADDGRVNRDEVARRAFADPADRAWLEGLLWPRVGRRVAEFREQAGAQSPSAIVVEVPLLFEAGMEGAFDATIAVVADDELRGERTADRNLEGLAEREARQLSQDEKAVRATHVVKNSGSIDELRERLSDVLAKLSR